MAQSLTRTKNPEPRNDSLEFVCQVARRLTNDTGCWMLALQKAHRASVNDLYLVGCRASDRLHRCRFFPHRMISVAAVVCSPFLREWKSGAPSALLLASCSTCNEIAPPPKKRPSFLHLSHRLFTSASPAHRPHRSVRGLSSRISPPTVQPAAATLESNRPRDDPIFTRVADPRDDVRICRSHPSALLHLHPSTAQFPTPDGQGRKGDDALPLRSARSRRSTATLYLLAAACVPSLLTLALNSSRQDTFLKAW
ncbi:hypothetical protein DFH07DRAFT_290814 [Mycena maculata]|uniref:Uncharacterized protein n=1 Tax=Mycena maculata TaxID=230809 RepID=A0AAD7NNR0_9AGAR|nr:hypothetical protein DFH07DRAFT_290814 [Mycena maculata]